MILIVIFFYLTLNLQFFLASYDFELLQLLTSDVEFHPVIPFSLTQTFLTGHLNYLHGFINKLQFLLK